MIVESWITPEETPALAAAATTMIDARLARFGDAERAAFWASIRKAYNTPYNDPNPRERPKPVKPVEAPVPPIARPEIALPEIALPELPQRDIALPELPLAVIAAAGVAELHVA